MLIKSNAIDRLLRENPNLGERRFGLPFIGGRDDHEEFNPTVQKIADAIENKGTLKISRLKKEQLLRQKKQIEESCGAKKKAALTSKQLKKKKRARKAEERADAANAITPYKKQTEEDNESNPSSSSDMTTPGSVIDVAVTADTGCAPADASSVDVSL